VQNLSNFEVSCWRLESKPKPNLPFEKEAWKAGIIKVKGSTTILSECQKEEGLLIKW